MRKKITSIRRVMRNIVRFILYTLLFLSFYITMFLPLFVFIFMKNHNSSLYFYIRYILYPPLIRNKQCYWLLIILSFSRRESAIFQVALPTIPSSLSRIFLKRFVALVAFGPKHRHDCLFQFIDQALCSFIIFSFAFIY
jgi:hypothetical protein